MPWLEMYRFLNKIFVNFQQIYIYRYLEKMSYDKIRGFYFVLEVVAVVCNDLIAQEYDENLYTTTIKTKTIK